MRETMREKNYNAGLRGVLFEARHYERMGSAIWLFGWLVLRQTHQTGETGWVLGGKPVSYREIEEETGFNARTLERWMQTLRRHGYIETDAVQGGVVIRIAKAKKFPQPGRNFAEGSRKSAGGGPQRCGANRNHREAFQQVPAPISSSFIADQFINPQNSPSVENQRQNQFRNQLQTEPHNRSAHHVASQEEFERRRHWQLLRAEREEAVRRELAVGAGPERTRR
ncbi:MAG TPA: hypothetical protein VMU43_08125 [Candidatus Acidoferrum sp.]|nr:hypothetical protein [Candidatus Acidoferrum sp.]